MSLLSPLTLPSGLVLPNRIAKSAMTEGLATCQGLPSEALLRLYRRWAASGAGLLITGNVGIDRNHPVRPRDVVCERGAPVEPFQKWARAAQSGGARVVMQLNHAGRQTPRFINATPLGPSSGAAVKIMNAFGPPRAATEAEIADIVRRHGDAAAVAVEAGFDGVQVHAAHGYLLNQFLSPDINVRTDGWGGDVRGRARLLVECVRAVREAIGPRRSVLVKLNSGDFLRGGFSEDEALEVVAMLGDVDLLEISGGRYESSASFGYATGDIGAREAYFLGFARRAREATSAPIMLTGGLRSRAAMEAALAENALDVVGIARPMALVPDYPRRLLAGETLPKIASPRIGIRALAAVESAAELAWYYLQLARLAEGRDAKPGISGLRALAWFFVGDQLHGVERRVNRLRGRDLPILATQQPH